VKDGVITAASSTIKATNNTSAAYQQSFASSVSSAVVGKKISSLNLNAIGGASLTTGAFEKFVMNNF
jgi:hypothetical protein